MRSYDLSPHAVIRMSQRGFQLSDIDIAMTYGTEVEGGFLVRRRDIQEIEQAVKSFLQRVRRLEGTRMVEANGTVISAYHTTARKEQELLRRKPGKRKR